MYLFSLVANSSLSINYLSYHKCCKWSYFLLQKTVVSVDMLCNKCKKKVMQLVAGIEGIDSIVLAPSKRLVTVIGDADPSEIIRKIRKFRKSAQFVSIGPSKDEKKDEKKDTGPCFPRICQKCDVWYVIGEDDYNYCSIL